MPTSLENKTKLDYCREIDRKVERHQLIENISALSVDLIVYLISVIKAGYREGKYLRLW